MLVGYHATLTAANGVLHNLKPNKRAFVIQRCNRRHLQKDTHPNNLCTTNKEAANTESLGKYNLVRGEISDVTYKYLERKCSARYLRRFSRNPPACESRLLAANVQQTFSVLNLRVVATREMIVGCRHRTRQHSGPSLDSSR
eukprot:1175550-Prorocentrum_minimum.AAC.2